MRSPCNVPVIVPNFREDFCITCCALKTTLKAARRTMKDVSLSRARRATLSSVLHLDAWPWHSPRPPMSCTAAKLSSKLRCFNLAASPGKGRSLHRPAASPGKGMSSWFYSTSFNLAASPGKGMSSHKPATSPSKGMSSRFSSFTFHPKLPVHPGGVSRQRERRPGMG